MFSKLINFLIMKLVDRRANQLIKNYKKLNKADPITLANRLYKFNHLVETTLNANDYKLVINKYLGTKLEDIIFSMTTEAYFKIVRPLRSLKEHSTVFAHLEGANRFSRGLPTFLRMFTETALLEGHHLTAELFAKETYNVYHANHGTKVRLKTIRKRMNKNFEQLTSHQEAAFLDLFKSSPHLTIEDLTLLVKAI